PVDRDVGVAVPRLAGRALPRGAAPAPLARALRRGVRHGRGEQRLLPAARAVGVRAVAPADPARLRRGGAGEPLPHPPPAPRRAGRGAGPPPRPLPAAAAPDAAGRPGPPGRLPAGLPVGCPGGGRAPPPVVGGRRGAGRARAPGRGPVLGRPRRATGDAAVA